MPRIFISYRRDDSTGHAGRIHERLASVFGSSSVFMDVDDIAPGTNFVRAIDNSVKATDFMVVLIGKQWLSLRDETGRRRIDNIQDFVHIEIAQALALKIPVIPVLLNNTTMPSEQELPPRLKLLARLQAMSLSEERWDYDVQRLIRVLEKGKGKVGQTRRRIEIIAVILLIALSLVLGAMLLMRKSPPLDLTGRWTSPVTYDFGPGYTEVFVFLQDQDRLNGTASFLEAERGILEGRVDGNRIEFQTRSEEQQGDERRQVNHEYRGTIAGNASEIQFVMQTIGGFSHHPPVEFLAKRAP